MIMEATIMCTECNGSGEVEQNILCGEEGMKIEMDVLSVCSECEGSKYLTINKMTTTELIKKHQSCIEILVAVLTFEMLIKSGKENIDGFCGTFPELRRKYIHNVEIYKMCIDRLNLRYKTLREGF